jgi:hypothetical protein
MIIKFISIILLNWWAKIRQIMRHLPNANRQKSLLIFVAQTIGDEIDPRADFANIL